MKLRVAIILLSFLAWLDAFPQDINFTHLTINDGLSQNTIYSLYQDKTNFVWIGTEDGLNRFDGYEFKIYQHQEQNPNSIRSNQVNSIYQNGDGNLWIGTAKGLDLFDLKTEKFQHINLKQIDNVSISRIITDQSGDVWLGTNDGVKKFDLKNNRIISFSNSQNLNGQSKRTYALYLDKKGIVWAGVGSEIIRINSKSNLILPEIKAFTTNPLWGKSSIRAIKLSENGNIWISTEKNGLFLYQSEKQRLDNYLTSNSKILSNTIRDIYLKNDHEIWLGTRDGLCVFNVALNQFNNFITNRYNDKSLNHNSIRCFMEDASGSIWLGTFAGGVNIAENSVEKFKLIKEQFGNVKGINNRVVSSLAQTSTNDYWIGTEGGGLNYYDSKNNNFAFYLNGTLSANNPKNIIKAISVDENKNLWVGTVDGLSYFNTQSRSFINLQLPNNGPLSNSNLVYALQAEGNGAWVGTNGGGLTYMVKDGLFKSYTANKTYTNNISSNNITAILNPGGNALWVGTENGLNQLDKKRGKFIAYFENLKNGGLSSSSILSLFIDSKKRFWVGTNGGGLNLYIGKEKFAVIDDKSGLANNVIHAILEDKNGNIWVSTNKGLSEISFKSTLKQNITDNIAIRNFNNTDGLQSNQFTAAALKSSSGQLFFGGINGVNYFNPKDIIFNNYKPHVVFTDFLIKNKSVSFTDENSPLSAPINLTKRIVLPYDEAFITLKFAALSYINASKNQYAYRLKGLKSDDDWHFVGNQRNATFTNLPAGNYTFIVKAANNDGVWSEQETAIDIKVLPPFWRTWWAYCFYLSIIGLLLYLFYYFSVKTARLKVQLDLEHITREKELELNHHKMSFFTNISHEIKTPLTLILAPIEKMLGMNQGNNKMQNQLMLMQRNGDHLLRLINQLLDFRKFDSGEMQLQAAEGNMVRFVKEVVFAFKTYAEHKMVELSVEADSDSIRVWFDRDKFEKILYNLISNSLKFTRPGGKITISLNTDPENNKVRISVSDTGKGIKQDYLGKIFNQFNQNYNSGSTIEGSGIGLSFTKGLVELHHGEIFVESQSEEKGRTGFTTFTIELPLGKAHLASNQIIADYKDSENIEAYQNKEIQPKLPVHKPKTSEESEKARQIMLVVEDNPDVLDFISSHFADEFEVETASNGLVGLEKATSLIPDIVISDVMMPEMSGTELCGKLKSDVRTSHIPVILLTARTPLVFKIEGLETGADDYITKPFNLALLEARVWNLLQSREKLRERFKKEVTLLPTNMAITSPDEKFLEVVMKFIEDNMSEPILSVEEMGKQVAMSRVTLYRKIKALTNLTAIEFIRSVRLKRAAQLLQQNKINVSEVSYMVGFSDVDYFRKCFKQQFGSTPTEYISGSKDLQN